MFTISIRNEAAVCLVIPEGRLDTLNSAAFNDKVQLLVDQEDHLIIDFRSCNYLSSTGIRSLMAAAKKLAAKRGSLMLANLSPEVYQVIEMTGLHKVFPVFKDAAGAREEVLRLRKSIGKSSEISIGDYQYQVQDNGISAGQAWHWVSPDIAGFDELALSAGSGTPAESLVDDGENQGSFFTIGNCAGFIPFNKNMQADFRVVSDPSAAGIFLQHAWSFSPAPTRQVKLAERNDIDMSTLLEALTRIQQMVGSGMARGMVIADFNEFLPSISVGIIADDKMRGGRFLLNSLPDLNPGESFTEFVRRALNIENIEGVGLLDQSMRLTNPIIWLFDSDVWGNPAENRIKVETSEPFPFEPYKMFMARRLYIDSARVVVKQLHGGYSAQTFQVESFDREGRKLRPTVLKIANRNLIAREASRCQEYALPYIMNNSAIVLGTVFFCDQGALRYNFVGIGGEQTRLRWLTHLFNEWPTAQLEPLFDKIFLQILKPWYGQPVKGKIYPYRDQDPTTTFFTTLCETAMEQLSIHADDQYMLIEETGEKWINPYWFLKHEYPARRNQAIDYYSSICHGDLNMQNILLDQEMNVYLIDFSETKPRSAISDFARLEAIFMIEHAVLETPDDRKLMIDFTTEFYNRDRLTTVPDLEWHGRQPEKMHRNLSLTRRMRQYALECTSGDPNIVPYYLALLEWILPIVCYGGVPVEYKRLSAYVAGMLCQKIIEKA